MQPDSSSHGPNVRLSIEPFIGVLYILEYINVYLVCRFEWLCEFSSQISGNVMVVHHGRGNRFLCQVFAFPVYSSLILLLQRALAFVQHLRFLDLRARLVSNCERSRLVFAFGAVCGPFISGARQCSGPRPPSSR